MVRITSAVSILVGVLGVSVSTSAVVTYLPDQVRAALKEPSGFQIRATVSNIPVVVRASFAKAVGEEPFGMAEPGAAWQATDVVRTPNLPRRRLGKVALSQSFCILFYELGGRGHSEHVVVFRLSPVGATLVWRAVLDQGITEPSALLRAIDLGKVDDDPKYGF
jgi:hypothetical protein